MEIIYPQKVDHDEILVGTIWKMQIMDGTVDYYFVVRVFNKLSVVSYYCLNDNPSILRSCSVLTVKRLWKRVS